MPDVVAILLAAGGGSRFRGPTHKLLAQLPAHHEHPAETVFQRSLATVCEAAVGPVVVITGASQRDELAPPTARTNGSRPDTDPARDERPPPEVTWVHNDRWHDGQMTSVQAGLRAARRLAADRVVIGLADQPGITADAWRTIASTDATLAVATYDGRRGNPVALHSDIWTLLPAEGDEGARSLMRLHPELVVEVPCEGFPHDIDTTEDLRRWQNNSSTNSP